MGINYQIEEIVTIEPRDYGKEKKIDELLEKIIAGLEYPEIIMVYSTSWEEGYKQIQWIAEKERQNEQVCIFVKGELWIFASNVINYFCYNSSCVM